MDARVGGLHLAVIRVRTGAGPNRRKNPLPLLPPIFLSLLPSSFLSSSALPLLCSSGPRGASPLSRLSKDRCYHAEKTTRGDLFRSVKKNLPTYNSKESCVTWGRRRSPLAGRTPSWAPPTSWPPRWSRVRQATLARSTGGPGESQNLATPYR